MDEREFVVWPGGRWNAMLFLKTSRVTRLRIQQEKASKHNLLAFHLNRQIEMEHAVRVHETQLFHDVQKREWQHLPPRQHNRQIQETVFLLETAKSQLRAQLLRVRWSKRRNIDGMML